MSTIQTRSKFYWGTLVTSENFAIDFDEGGPEKYASLPIADYTLTEYAAAWQAALRLTGTQLYNVTFNRTTRKITVSAPNPFTLRCNTGSRNATAAWAIAGFATTSNKTGSNSYTGENPAGYEYITQLPLSQYISVEHSSVKENAAVNTTAHGITQIVHYGRGSRPKMNIRGITNKINLNMTNFYQNASGVQNALDFMEYLIDKNKVEFMPNVNDPSIFHKLFLEATPQGRNGVEFELQNMAVDWYETGQLTFREVLT